MPQPVEPVSEPVRLLIQAINNFHGIIHRGNIDLAHRPKVHNPDGSYSTVDSLTFTLPGGRAVLVPSVIRQGSQWVHVTDPKLAWAAYQQTGHHLGIFQNEKQAEAYAQLLHRQQAAYYGG